MAVSDWLGQATVFLGRPVLTEIKYGEWMSDNDAQLWRIERDPWLQSTS